MRIEERSFDQFPQNIDTGLPGNAPSSRGSHKAGKRSTQNPFEQYYNVSGISQHTSSEFCFSVSARFQERETEYRTGQRRLQHATRTHLALRFPGARRIRALNDREIEHLYKAAEDAAENASP